MLGSRKKSRQILTPAKKSSTSPVIFNDDEFGKVKVIRNNGQYMRARIRVNGEIVLSVPKSTSLKRAKAFFDQTKPKFRASLEQIANRKSLNSGDMISKHYQLIVRTGVRENIQLKSRQVIVTVPKDYTDLQIEQAKKAGVSKVLKEEASNYLPKRLKMFALKYGYTYKKVRLNFAKTRWGSCSTSGTISLNISLMKLPSDLIDYVLLHELAHTKQMNHGPNFWAQLISTLPDARERNNQLKDYSPYI